MPIDLSVLNPALPFVGPRDLMLVYFDAPVHATLTVADIDAELAKVGR